MEKRQALEQLLMMKEHEVIIHCVAFLEHLYKNVKTDLDNYVIAQGESPIALVAHVDTVSWGTKAMTLSWNKNVLRNETGVLGADDRAGVFGIMEALVKIKKQNLPLPTIILTNYEESGGRGVKKLIEDKALNIEGLHLMVELDRKGCNEYVYYTSSLPQQVKNYVESFGYVKKEGSYSDILDLAFAYKIPAVNLSIGYYSQHTAAEVLHWDEMWLTINRVVSMVADPIPALYKLSDSDLRSWSGGYYGGGYGLYGKGNYGSFGDYSEYYDTYHGTVVNLPNAKGNSNHLAAIDREWPTDGRADEPSEVDFESDLEFTKSSLELEFADFFKVELYDAIKRDAVEVLVAQQDDVEMVAFIDDFTDLFQYEISKLGYFPADQIKDEDFEESFESTWKLCMSIHIGLLA